MAHFGKFLSLVLRHKPEIIGVTLDAQGWCYVSELIEKLNAHGEPTTMEKLEKEVSADSKQRYNFNEDKTKIRANQGHSLKVDLALEAQTPPNELFHGTVEQFLPSIMASGLEKRQRQHVHLSRTKETAVEVGKRRGVPIILVVNAKQMVEDGYKFFLSANQVWLTDSVPSRYITRLG